ncbi:SAGA-associated factor 29, partial [Tolypocladium paradoxum]
AAAGAGAGAGGAGSNKSKVVFAKGDAVAFRPTSQASDWILGEVAQVMGEGKSRRYKVLDIEPDPQSKQKEYKSSASSMIAIAPESAAATLKDWEAGKVVLALYPNTTTFYKAEVHSMDGDGRVNLKFEGENDSTTLQQVERRGPHKAPVAPFILAPIYSAAFRCPWALAAAIAPCVPACLDSAPDSQHKAIPSPARQRRRRRRRRPAHRTRERRFGSIRRIGPSFTTATGFAEGRASGILVSSECWPASRVASHRPRLTLALDWLKRVETSSLPPPPAEAPLVLAASTALSSRDTALRLSATLASTGPRRTRFATSADPRRRRRH